MVAARRPGIRKQGGVALAPLPPSMSGADPYLLYDTGSIDHFMEFTLTADGPAGTAWGFFYVNYDPVGTPNTCFYLQKGRNASSNDFFGYVGPVSAGTYTGQPYHGLGVYRLEVSTAIGGWRILKDGVPFYTNTSFEGGPGDFLPRKRHVIFNPTGGQVITALSAGPL